MFIFTNKTVKTKNKALGLTLLGLFAFGHSTVNAAACASATDANCCGNGKIETINGVTKECDLGFGLNTGGADTDPNANPLSGCTPSCTKATPDWDCSNFSTKQTLLSNLYKKLVAAMVNVKINTDAQGNVTIINTPATDDASRIYGVDPYLCKYYLDPTTSPDAPVLFPDLGKQVQGNLDVSKCAAYAADFYKFVRLNYSLPVNPNDCTTAHNITKSYIDWAYIDLYNPSKITNMAQYTRYRNNYGHNYMVNGCLTDQTGTPVIFTQ